MRINRNVVVKRGNSILLVAFLMLTMATSFAQKEHLLIGRTTGQLAIKKQTTVRVFGFSTSLSGQVTLPGPCIEAMVGDSIAIDFWNISQGNPVSLTCNAIPFLQYDEEAKTLLEKQPIDHMEHGFYAFKAEKSGTYLYYSPENYPFNLQAGLFGTIIIRAKEEDSKPLKAKKEMLWCSYEMDPKWHTDAIMDVEHSDLNKPILLPDYKPNYFLINGKPAKKTTGLQAVANKNEPVLLRMVNAGLYLHEIQFPKNLKVQLVSGKPKAINKTTEGYLIQLLPGECLEFLAFLEAIKEKEKLIYRFIEPTSEKIVYKASIPIFY